MIAEPQRVQGAWWTRLQEKVGGGHEPLEQFVALGAGHVQGDAAFIGRIGPPVETALGLHLVPIEGPDAPRGMASRRLDLNHVSAEVGEDFPTEEALGAGEIQHPIGTE